MNRLDILSRLVIPGIAVLWALIPGTIAVLTFRRSTQTRRAEWLHTLYSKFFEDERYSDIRLALDYGPAEQLYDAARTGTPRELADRLNLYLNFFEFVAGLAHLGQLKPAEVTMLFDYYLRLLKRHPPILAQLQPQGFEQLNSLLGRMEPENV
jgi:hypothetical protein